MISAAFMPGGVTSFTSFLANFEIFSKCFQLFQGQKNIFCKKCSKNGLVSKKK